MSATVTPVVPVIPKDVASGVQVVVTLGGQTLSASAVAQYLGGNFQIEGEYSGPGLSQTVDVPQSTPATNSLILDLPAVNESGNYTLSNLRFVVNGNDVLDLTPNSVTVNVIDQVLVTSVQTQALTLAQIQQMGVVLDSSDYTGFQFTVGLQIASQTVNISLPVVFNSQGVSIPIPTAPATIGGSQLAVSVPGVAVVPVLLKIPPNPNGPPGVIPPNVQIPSILVIPGNVGYLKQFFSAQLYVANNSPAEANLSVDNITGTINLPVGPSGVVGGSDEPLALPTLTSGPEAITMPVTMNGAGTLAAGQTGEAQWTIVANSEGFYNINFGINATLEGLPTGPVALEGTAAGGLLVRNPYFDMTFTVPSVVRSGEPFNVFTTVTNISQAIANNLTVSLDAASLTGMTLVGPQPPPIATLNPGDSVTLEYQFSSTTTGAVVANYLNFNTNNGTTGTLNFTMGVYPNGTPMSPDTIQLPSSVDSLPSDLVSAAMRVLGQAWSVATAPPGSLPASVIPTTTAVVTKKAQALAEAGLRQTLGETQANTLRDLAPDFWGGSPVDPGFNQVLQTTPAGMNFNSVLGWDLAQWMLQAGGPLPYEQSLSQVLVSGSNFLSFAVGNGNSSAPVNVSLTDGSGNQLSTMVAAGSLPGGVLLELNPNAYTPLVGLVTAPSSSPYTLLLTPTSAGTADLSISIPSGSGTVIRAQITGQTVTPGQNLRVVADLTNPNNLVLQVDTNGDGSFATSIPLTTQTISPPGPTLTSVSVVGPETVSGAGPYGLNVAFLFDRPVGNTTASNIANYVIPNNVVQSAASELSGRLVFGNLQEPEGPYVPTTMAVSGIADLRGVIGPSATVNLQSTLVDPGAVVSGQVLNANGTPSTTAIVTYLNYTEQLPCEDTIIAESGIAATPVNAQGYYQFRYVWQNSCGLPFSIATNDPQTGALQEVNQNVRAAGQQIVLNLAMIGTGSVTGQVKDLLGNPVSDAVVQAVSGTNPQVSGVAYTDGNGYYTINNITVGPVTVNAVQGFTVGSAAGNIQLAGAPATVNVTLNGGGVQVSGTVMEVQNGISTPVAGAVVYYSTSNGPNAVTTTATDGSYSMSNLPAGAYQVYGAINTSLYGAVAGVSVAGDNLTVPIQIVVPTTGTVNGQVLLPNGTPYSGAVVYENGATAGTLSAANGSYSLTGVPINPSGLQTISAFTTDGLRTGQTTVSVPSATPVNGANITLSGLGTARFVVLGVTGQPAVGVTVYQVVLGSCAGTPQVTDANGSVTFTGVQVGAVTASAVQTTGGYYDLASATVLVTQDGITATGTMQFHGVGTVTGSVTDPHGNAVSGAVVQLTSNSPDFSVCQMGTSNSQSVQTSANGQFSFTNVNIGPVSVEAIASLYATPATGSGVLSTSGSTINFPLQFVNTVSGVLSGNVFLPDGITPAPGVQITATGPFPATNTTTVTTNSTGAYQFAPILAEGNYTITAADPVSGGVAQANTYMRPAVNVTQNMTLLGTGTVNVTVVDGAGNAVNSAFVTLTETGYPNGTFNGPINASNQGVAAFGNVYDGSFNITVTDLLGRAGLGSGTLPQNVPSVNVQVQLATTGVVQGYFYLPDGVTGIPNAVVQLTQNGSITAETITQGTGNIGSFTFNYVPAGPFTLTSQDPATGRNGIATGSITSQGQILNVNLVAQGLTTVTGLVTENSAPQPGATVTIQSGTFTASTTSDSTGTYLIAGVPTGTIVATASLSGSFSGTATGSETADGSTLTLPVALQSSGSITGQVLQANGTSPAPPCLVTINIAGSIETTSSDAQGNFSFAQVPSGSGTITVRELSGIDTGSTPVTVPAGTNTTVTVMLNGTGSVSGTAYTSAGAPTTGTIVLNGAGSIYYSYTTTAAADGTFSFATVPAGPFTAMLTASVDGFTLYGMASGTVQPYNTTTITISTQPSGTVSGQIFHSDGVTPDAGAQVSLTGAPQNGTSTVVADSNGNYSFTGVPLGAFTLNVTDPVTGDRGAATSSITTNGQSLTVNIALNGVGSVTVNVNYATGGIVPNAAITLTGTGPFGGSYTGTTGPSGTYTFPYVLAGGFTVTASDPVTQFGGIASSSVTPNGTTSVTVQLQPVLTVEGYVYNTFGAGVSGSTLVLSGYNITGFFSVQALSATNGSFEFANLQEAQYTLSSYDSVGNLRARSSTFSLSTVGPTTVNLTWQAIGTVTGFVYDPNGSPAIGAPVTVQSLNYGLTESLQTSTDGTGAYTVNGVPIGNFTVSVSYPTAQLVGSASGSITQSGQQVTIDVYLVSNAISLPIYLTDGNGYSYDAQPNGTIGSGAAEIFSYFLQPPDTGAFNLNILSGGSVIPFTGNSEASQELSGKQVDITQDQMAGLTVTRKIYVPPSGYFVRYVEELTNPGATPVTVGVQIVSNQAAQYWPDSIVASSTGNATLNVTNTQNPDRWVVIDGTERNSNTDGGLPIVAYAFDGPGAAMPVDTASFSTPLYDTAQVVYQWSTVTVPAGGTVALLHFGSQQSSRATAAASAARLIQLPPEALTGISSQDLAAIQNFVVPANGTSLVAPLPALNGTITGYLYSGDGTTPIPGQQVTLQSNNAYFNRPQITYTNATGLFTFSSSLNSNSTMSSVLPVDLFTLSLSNAPPALGAVNVTANFPAGQNSVAQNLVLVGTGTVTGAVTFSNGTPVTSGQVYATDSSAPNYTPSTTISSNGTYLLGGVPAGVGQITAYTNLTTYTTLSGTAQVDVIAGEDVTANIALQATAVVQGTITDNFGNPVSNASVSLQSGYFSSYASTNASGIYSFINIPAGTYGISAGYGNTSYGSATITVAAGQTYVQNFSEAPNGTVQVNVTYSTGGLATNAFVYITPSASSGNGFTNGSGNITFTGVPLGPFTVTSYSPSNYTGTVTVNGNLATNGATVAVSVVLPAPAGVASVSGEILYARGVPATGLIVSAYNASNYSTISATTDVNGNYTLSGLTANTPVTVNVYTSGYQSLTSATVNVGAAGTTTTQNFSLPAMATLQVTVLDATGFPVSGRTVYILDANTSGYFYYGAATNSSGIATIPNVPQGAFTVQTNDPYTGQVSGSASGTVAVSNDGGSISVTINLPLMTNVQGTVFAADGQTPVAYATVTAIDPANNDAVLSSTSTGPDGSYQLYDLAPSTSSYQIVATAPENQNITATANGSYSSTGETEIINLTLPLSILSGQITYSDGTPVPYPTVFASQTDAFGNVTSYAAASTDGSGDYTVYGIPVGAFTVYAQDSNTGLSGSASSSIVQLSTSVQLTVPLQPSGTVLGNVQIWTGGAVPYAQVTVSSSAINFDRYTTADPNGNYSMTGIALGEVVVSAPSPSSDYTTGGAIAGAVATSGQNLTLNVPIAQTSNVQGTVFAADGVTPVPGAYMAVESLLDGGLAEYRNHQTLSEGYIAYKSDSNGNFTFSGVPIGSVEVTAAASDGSTAGWIAGTLGTNATLTLNPLMGNATAFPSGSYVLTDPNGFVYDIACDGSLTQGGQNQMGLAASYSGAALLLLDTNSVGFCQENSVGALDQNNQQVTLGPQPGGAANALLEETRQVYVPPAGGYVRYLDSLTNPLSVPITTTVEIDTNFASDDVPDTLVVDPTTDGSTFALLQDSTSTAPLLGFVFAGSNSALAPVTSFMIGTMPVSYVWTVTVPANSTVTLMHFLIQWNSQDTNGATSQGNALVNLTDPNELNGMSTQQKAQVVNFNVQ